MDPSVFLSTCVTTICSARAGAAAVIANQEWTSVFLLNTVDGCLPSDLATGTTPEIEEERRLLYVAMTRAKDQLHLMVPQRFFTHGQRSTGDRHVYAQRTRFIPDSVLGQFKSWSWPPPKSVSEGGARTRGRVDVRGKMRQMWG
jgi:DNA helicase-2/ATP-dependent DNA helicase PcrA